jgi:outer membrane protein assembly factor BamA
MSRFGRQNQQLSKWRCALNSTLVRNWCLAGALLLSWPSFAQPECELLFDPDQPTFELDFDRPSPNPSNDNGLPLVIGEIIVQRHSIFDESSEAQQNGAFRFANDIHFLTKERVVRDYLLFATGDVFDDARLLESERLLRQQKFFYGARVIPFRQCGDRVDVLVVTRDTWSLTPILSVSSQGGQTKSKVGVRDTNFLGSGNRVSLIHEQDYERSKKVIYFENPNLGSHNLKLGLLYATGDRFDEQQFTLIKPFFSLDSKQAMGAFWFDTTEDIKQYQFTHAINAFNRREQKLGGFLGWMYRRDESWVKRALLGFDKIDYLFTPALDPNTSVDLPEDRQYAYAWVGIQAIEDNYQQLRNHRYMDVIEDINLGWDLEARLGWRTDSNSTVGNSAYFSLRTEKYFALNESHLVRSFSTIEGFFNTDQKAFDNTLLNFDAEYFYRATANSQDYFHLNYRSFYNMSSDQQVILDGANGMRGYPLHFLSGNESLLLQYEKRWYTDWYWWRLARVGVVAYADVGKVWDDGKDQNITLADVGFGLRLMSTRAFVRNVIHIDVAFPVEKHPNADTWQISFLIKEGF